MTYLGRIWLGVAMAGMTLAANNVPTAAADEPPVVRLWSEAAPLATGDKPEDQPTLTVFLPPPDKANGTAVVVCPGGGYANLAMGHEGVDIARWWNERGVTALVLKYRLSTHGYRHPAPMLDVKRALRTARHRAREWNIDPQRIGVMGFSAGGHLASTAATHFDAGEAEAADPVERQSSRPDFAVLCYAVIQFGQPTTNMGSQRNLLGNDADAQLIEKLSNEKQVTAETPPTFLFHTHEDTVVPPENSVVFYQALKKHGVPAELHLYEKGRHGVGLATSIPGTRSWPDRLEEWMTGHGLMQQR